MWEKFKTWFASDNFPWFMMGWCLAAVFVELTLFNVALVLFWAWVLFSDN